MLPHRRSFEFRRSDTAEIITEKVGGAIENAAEINRVLERNVRITVLTTCVGNGLPRYRLLGYEELPVGETRSGGARENHTYFAQSPVSVAHLSVAST